MRKQGRPYPLVGLHGELEILEHAVLLEDGGLLELAADAGVGDLRFRKPCKVDGLAEEHRASVGTRLARDHVHHGGLARAVRADYAAQLADVDRQRKLGKRLETVEADRDVLQVEHHAVRDVEAPGGDVREAAALVGGGGVGGHAFFLSRPMMPCGRNSVTRMKMRPSAYSQYSGKACVKKLFAPLTAPAPMIAPASVPRPPTATQMAISIELAGDISLGLMMPTCGT